MLLTAALQETLPSFELERGDRTIRVQQTATDAEGGIFAQRSGCRTEGKSLTTVYAPAPNLVETTIADTVITSNIVLREQPSGDQDAAVLEHIAGTLEFDEESFCPAEIEPSGKPDVTLRQGRTTIHGTSFTYDNATGVGVMAGPVDLTRQPEDGVEELTATADALEFNVDENSTLLTGNVQITSGDRRSEASTVDYDEAAGFAVLRGDPAVSRLGQDVVEGRIIEYDLNTNDVVVMQGVRASFEFER